MVSYEPLWRTMKEKNISTYKLLQAGVDKRTLHNLKHNRNITMFTVERICRIVGCGLEDMVEFTDEDEI